MRKIKVITLRPSKGFTIIELLLYMGIFSILLILFMQMFISIVDVQLSSQETSSVTQDGRFLLSRVLYDINRAQAIVVPASFGLSSSSLQLTINGAQYTYSTNSGVLNLTNNVLNTTDALTSIDTSISNFNVIRLKNTTGKDTLQITFTLTSKTTNNGNFQTRTFQTTGGLR